MRETKLNSNWKISVVCRDVTGSETRKRRKRIEGIKGEVFVRILKHSPNP